MTTFSIKLERAQTDRTESFYGSSQAGLGLPLGSNQTLRFRALQQYEGSNEEDGMNPCSIVRHTVDARIPRDCMTGI